VDLWPIIANPLSEDDERQLVEILRFDGRLHLAESSELPHSMPPEDMLKSLAVQALAKWTGTKYIEEMVRAQVITRSSSLASLIGNVIRKVTEQEDCTAVAAK
jgi:hypothetical protein